VIKALREAGMLIARARLTHQYPHSWRSKKPVIFRNTPQWFIAMDKPFALVPSSMRGKDETLRARALAAIEATRWVPQQGENRITGMIESRPDWVISRQRAWGVPITVFIRPKPDGSVDVLSDPDVNARILDAFAEEGADAWYQPDRVSMGEENYADYHRAIHDPATVLLRLHPFLLVTANSPKL